MSRLLALALTVVVSSPSGCSPSGGANKPGSGKDAAVPGAEDMAPDGHYYAPAGYQVVPFLSETAAHEFAAADMVLAPGKDYLAVLETDAGRLVLDLFETQTPITVNSFVFLALHHYFDGIAFHRVLDGFMAQGGDPNTLDADRSGWGTGGPGYYFGLEIVDGLTYDAAGVVGMARTQNPDTNGSQFFITFGPTPSLNRQYTIFARVTEGADVLPQIARGEPPANPTRMARVYIVAK